MTNNLKEKSKVDYRDPLINSLYAQVEYLKRENIEKNGIIKSLIVRLDNPLKIKTAQLQTCKHESRIKDVDECDLSVDDSLTDAVYGNIPNGHVDKILQQPSSGDTVTSSNDSLNATVVPK